MEEAAKSLVNIGQLVGEEFRNLRGVGGEVARLRNELATINALLRMQSEADEGAVDHFLREWMKQLREVSYDAEDYVDLYRCRVRRRSADPLLVQWKRLLGTLWARRRLAGDIRDLRALAAATNEQHARYGLSLERLRRPAAASPPVAASRHAPLHRTVGSSQSQLIGIEEQATSLSDRIKKPASNDDKKLKVFSIVGFGGLGKTTLAMEVCRQLEVDFPTQAQVSVSQVFDLKGLLKRVLQQILEVKVRDRRVVNSNEQAHPLQVDIDSMQVEQLGEELKKTLTNKRYLILVDDVWTVAAWEVILSKLPPESNHGSRIIVTTRIETVAKACSGAIDDHYIHHIQKLNEENSKMLFLSRAFGSDPCPTELEDVMGQVLRKCGGLPLAIISIASLLASYTSPEMWQTVLKSIGSQMESHPSLEGMRQIITLSFDHLPHHLKGCMMYLSIFPEDYIIGKDRLLRRWIAEGLVSEKRGLTLMEVAEDYFNDLVSRSMINQAEDIVSNLADERDETYRVHDMMLEVMVSKSLEANFVSLIGGQFEGMSYDRVRRLSVHGDHEVGDAEPSSSSSNKELNVQHVRSLSMFGLQADRHKLLDRIGEFTLLRVLDLEDCMFLNNKHLSSICQLYLLRFLSLKGTNIKALPSAISGLEHLETLDVRLTLLTVLPNSVTQLEKLESLQTSRKGSYWGVDWEAPKGLGKMKALRKLQTLTVKSNSEAIEDIGKLEQLQELVIYVGTIPEEAQKKLSLSLSRLHLLRRLNIEGWKSNSILYHLESPPRLLTHLRLCGNLDCEPGYRVLTNGVRLLTNLVDFAICFSYLLGDTLFDVLCTLPKLKMLTLETFFSADNMVVAKTGQSFKALTELRLCRNYQVPQSYRFETGSMPKLENLVVEFHDNHEQTLDGIENLTSLKEVQFIGKKSNKSMEVEPEKLRQQNKTCSSKGSNQIRVIVRYL